MNKLKQHPPRTAQKLLLLFLRNDLAEEVMGDLEEGFDRIMARKSRFKAKLNYWYQVVNYIRPFAIRKSKPYTSYPMIKNYFKIGWRNLIKNKTYSFINISGLGVGLACCMAIGLYLWDEYSYDRFHTGGENIYRIVERQNQAGTVYNVAATPGPLAAGLKTDFAEVEKTCRVMRKRSGFLQFDQISIEPRMMRAVDNSFFTMFNFRLIKGNVERALTNPNEIIITKDMAEKFFGSNWENSNTLLGSQITLNDKLILTLVGVAENPPGNSHIQFDVLLSFTSDELNSVNLSWNQNSYHTYVYIREGANVSSFNAQLENYLLKFDDAIKTKLLLQPLHDIYLKSDFAFNTDWSKTSKIVYVYIYLAVGLVVLIIALFNFINLSTARAAHRAKEVGIRKVTGASVVQVVMQFLSESLLITFFAVCFAFLLLQLFLPLLNDIAGKSLYLPIQKIDFILGILIFSLTISMIAGIYPAIYLSGFQPGKALKGFFSVQSGQLFRSSLVICQFAFSVILIVGSIVIYKQLIFLQDKDLGFDQSQLLYVRMKNKLLKNELILKEELANQASISSVTATSSNLIDVTSSTTGIGWEGQEPEDRFLITQTNIDQDFLVTAGMTLLTGRNFDKSRASDSLSYIVNETAAKRMGWTRDQALGKKLSLWGVEGEVIGVVRDFHFRPMTTLIEPFVFHCWPKDNYSGLLLKTMPGQTREAISQIERLYKKYESQTAVEYEFIDQALENQYRTEQNTGRIVLYFSILTVFVASLGLFGLATFITEQRIKEIGIRKVLGASVTTIVKMLSKDFLKLIGISILVALPIAWWSMNQWLQNFSYKINIEWWVFALAAIITIATALLTVSIKSIKAAVVNPVRSLRSE